MARFSYLKSVAVVFFAAVCAYAGAWLFPSLSGLRPMLPVTAAAESFIGLEGIALRHELALDPVGGTTFLPGEGERIPAASFLWRDEGGESFISGKSAVYMAGCDGFETLSPPEGEKLSMAQLLDFMNSTPDESPAQARLVEGFYWYYAALAPAGTPQLAMGSHYLKFEGFEEYTKALLVSREVSSDGQALLFRLRLGDPAYLKLRKCRAELLLSGPVT